MDWPLPLTTQPSNSKLCDKPESRLAFLLNCISKIPLRLCFHLQFELVVSAFQPVKVAGSWLLATPLKDCLSLIHDYIPLKKWVIWRLA